jgi:hypothetical protein
VAGQQSSSTPVLNNSTPQWAGCRYSFLVLHTIVQGCRAVCVTASEQQRCSTSVLSSWLLVKHGCSTCVRCLATRFIRCVMAPLLAVAKLDVSLWQLFTSVLRTYLGVACHKHRMLGYRVVHAGVCSSNCVVVFTLTVNSRSIKACGCSDISLDDICISLNQ